MIVLTPSWLSGTGNALNNVLNGNSGGNTLAGGAGNDTLDGGTGVDTLQGGTGDDTYVVDNPSDVVTENASEGTDTVQSSVTRTLGSNQENLVLIGGSAIDGIGNSQANAITGNDAANYLKGNSGDDSLVGGAGNDTLDGDSGADTMVGGTGDDLYTFSTADNLIVENASEGADAVQTSTSYTLDANVENLVLTGSSGISGTGNALDNVLTGNSGANLLTGGSGNDTLNGGSGADTMQGGTGDDTYAVDSSSDVVTENASEGTDTVQSSVGYSLGANLENLLLTGSSAINGTGNSSGNVITGNSSSNLLTGGSGSDKFVFQDALGPGNVDTVTDFSTGTDLLRLDDDIFAVLSGLSTPPFSLPGANFIANASGTAGDSDDYIIYNTSTGRLYYDADGNGAGASVHFATLQSAPALAASDIEVIA